MTRARAGAVVAGLATSAATVAVYVNQWGPQASRDTPTYLSAGLVDATRLPGYPMFLNLLGDSVTAASIAQAVLFIAAVLEVYALVWLLARRAWLATVAALAVGTNTYLVSFVKPAIVEGLALFLVTSLALAVVLYLREPTRQWVWLIAGVLLLTILTRPEWLWAPVPLFVLLFVLRRGLGWHFVGATLGICVVVGVYVVANTTLNGYPGLTKVERANLFGKVLQYRLHESAPRRYAAETTLIDRYLAGGGDPDPWLFFAHHPEFERGHHALAGEYARAAVLRNPNRYAAETAGRALGAPWTYPFAHVREDRPLAGLVHALHRVSERAIGMLSLVPLLALAWLLLRFGGSSLLADGMLTLALIGVYDVFVVTAAAYGDYMRLLVPIDPVRLIVVVVSLGVAAAATARGCRRIRAAVSRAQPAPTRSTA